MPQDGKQLLADWRHRARKTQKAHFHSAAICSRNHYILGVAVVLLATLAGSTLLTNFLEEVYIVVISISAATLAAVQTFLSLPERAEKHRIVAARLSDLKKRIEELQVFGRDAELRAATEELRVEWDCIIKDAPTALGVSWRKYSKMPKECPAEAQPTRRETSSS